MKINCTTIKNGIAYGWTRPDKPVIGDTVTHTKYYWQVNKYEKLMKRYNEAVDKARAEAIEWEDQVDAVDLLLPADARYDFGEHFDEPIDGDYSHEPIDVDEKIIKTGQRTVRIEGYPVQVENYGKKVLVIKPT